MTNETPYSVLEFLRDIVKNLWCEFKDEINETHIGSVTDVKEYTAPCFFVNLVSETEKGLIGDRANRKICVDVIFYPKSDMDSKKAYLLEMSHRLYSVLRFLNETEYKGEDENGKPIYTKNNKKIAYVVNMDHNIDDDELHCIVTYNAIVYYTQDPTAIMEDLNIIGGLND